VQSQKLSSSVTKSAFLVAFLSRPPTRHTLLIKVKFFLIVHTSHPRTFRYGVRRMLLACDLTS
jgi:hypothetical protein